MVWVEYQVLNTHIKIGLRVEQELVKVDPIQTYQLKGGVMYDINSDMNVFFNTGLVEKTYLG